MTDAISIALSGLAAQGQRLAVSANNIANASTIGALPSTQSPTSTVYKPLSVSYTALTANGTGAGVQTTVTENINGFSPGFDPSSSYANNSGLVAVPNVDIALEATNILETKSLFKANAAVIKTYDKMLGDLLDSIA